MKRDTLLSLFIAVLAFALPVKAGNINLSAIHSGDGFIRETLIPHTIAPQADTTKGKAIDCIFNQMPRFPGSHNEDESVKMILKFLHDHIRYPEKARKNNIEGVVYVTFLVEKDGSFDHMQVVSKPIGFGLEEEAIRVIKLMPRWTPGLNMRDGKPMIVQYNIPVKYKLTEARKGRH